MGVVEVSSVDPGRRAGEIGKDVAVDRGDGDDLVTLPKLHRFDIDIGIFPDLGVGETRKTKGRTAALVVLPLKGRYSYRLPFQLSCCDERKVLRKRQSWKCRPRFVVGRSR